MEVECMGPLQTLVTQLVAADGNINAVSREVKFSLVFSTAGDSNPKRAVQFF